MARNARQIDEDDQSERREKGDVGGAGGHESDTTRHNTEGCVRRVRDHEERPAGDARVAVYVCLCLSPSGSCHAGH